VISYFINGSVYEESERIYSLLGNFNSRDFDANEYKKFLMFKNISKETMFNYTIGGFASLRKTTLISVEKNSYFIRKIY
jgi:hypothetical protein